MSEVKVTPAYATGELRFLKKDESRILQQKHTVPMQDGTTQIVWLDIPMVEESKDESVAES